MINRQSRIQFSEHAVLYDMLIPKDHKFRRFTSEFDLDQ